MKKRTRIVIESAVQWSIARRLMLHWLLFFVTVIAFYTSLDVLLAIGELDPMLAFQQSLRKQLPLLTIIVLLMPIFLRDSLKLSLRFAGPVYRLKASLRDLATGEIGRPLKFRHGDFWSELATDFNQVRERLAKTESRATSDESLLHSH